jgi:site-specific DNA-methyltransferase (adenine-specific)
MKVTDKITITNEDNMELMKRYPDNYFSLAIVDPPYGIGIDKAMNANKGNQGFKQYKETEWDNETPNQEYFDELFRVSKNQIIWGGNYFIDKIKKPSQCFLIWNKVQRDFTIQ